MATLLVVVLPVTLIVIAEATIGIPEPRYLVAPMAGIILSLGALHLGTLAWNRVPISGEISFRELVLWQYLRRRHAERAIASSTHKLSTLGTASHPAPEARLYLLHRLAAAIEAKDRYTHGHSRRVEGHVYRTAMTMGLTRAEIEDLRMAASLHDVGKIEVPDPVLRKPRKLTPAEMEMVRRHPAVGARLVSQAVVPRVTSAVRSHHERWDGRGYPDGRTGHEIPLFARIISVADAYDAMTSTRPYRKALSHRAAVADLRTNAGSQFDPEIVEAFVSTLQRPVVAVGALVVLGLPIRAMRRVSTWAHNLGAEAIAGTMGATGDSALVGIAAVSGVVADQQRVPQVETSRPVVAPAPAQEEPIEILPAPAPKKEKDRRRNPSLPAAQKTNAAAPATAQGSETSGSAAGDRPPPAGHPEVQDSQTETPPASEEKQKDKKAEPGMHNGHTPHGDPQPDKGKDCTKANGGNGGGNQKHCG